MEEIAEFLRAELAAVEHEIGIVLEANTNLLKEVGYYVLSTKGKRLRPMMLLLSAKACGYHGDAAIKVAAAMEIIHTATLLHDDVIDKALLRRGRASVNAKWGDDVAILIADYLYASAFRLASKALNPKVIETICEVTAQMCEGEMFQIEKRQEFLTQEDYLRIVRHKTAFLFSACTALGASLADADTKTVLEMTEFGLNFGIAFQITDDTLDLLSQNEELGKDSGTDIRNGKQTLPLIYAYEKAPVTTQKKLSENWESTRDPEPFMALINEFNGIDYAISQAAEYSENAKRSLNVLPDSPAKEYCKTLADFVLKRNK